MSEQQSTAQWAKYPFFIQKLFPLFPFLNQLKSNYDTKSIAQLLLFPISSPEITFGYVISPMYLIKKDKKLIFYYNIWMKFWEFWS